MKSKKYILQQLLFPAFLFSFICCTTSQSINIDPGNLKVINRNLVDDQSAGFKVVKMDRQLGSGLAIIKDVEFEGGVIELDIQGENNPGKSFVGVAFNIQNDSTYEAIYFRPFNFHSEEQIRREHSMQYIFHPDFGWRKLRTEREGQFEAEYPNPPSPDDWFSVKIIVQPKMVVVMDQVSGTTLMEVERLSSQVSNKIGFWTGHNSKGSFRNLKIGKGN